jgi:four helix bundle protein
LEVRGWRFEAKANVTGRRFEAKMSNYLFPFEKLDVWKMSVDLADMVLNTLEKVAQGRHIRLISQMEAAVTSPSQNIAEGKGRQYKKEFIQFLHIAQGSVYEVVTLNEIFRRRKLFSEEESNEVRTRCEQIDRKLNGLINSLKGKNRNWVSKEII